eukprot:TRINITY_DN2970_c0_g4_i1.p1 TRINITY_DN2970_c0_g4~~TRINITY_DN2970_c0_g4_i1.p1  ORF type:complete len:108 (+),score=8.80 TRINITY_DN2970_c0_g4_i1:394-717(+)
MLPPSVISKPPFFTCSSGVVLSSFEGALRSSYCFCLFVLFETCVGTNETKEKKKDKRIKKDVLYMQRKKKKKKRTLYINSLRNRRSSFTLCMGVRAKRKLPKFNQKE